jgi:hypothetical protein
VNDRFSVQFFIVVHINFLIVKTKNVVGNIRKVLMRSVLASKVWH